MTTRLSTRLLSGCAALLCAAAAHAGILGSQTYNDSSNDIDPGIANAGGTLDLLSMEVSNSATDLVFRLTVNGSLNSTDWGKFMIGISTGGAGDTAGNGWGRPISMTSSLGGMDYWIGSWVDSGGGAQLWNYSASSWSGPGGLAGYSFSGNQITYTMSLSSLGLSIGDTFFFDAFSSGGGGGDSAIDALANPSVSVTGWNGPYTSSSNFSYTLVPGPGAMALIGVAGLLARRRRR
ncbi:MAG: hypothetical protein FGM37_03025 [Phycisphaerales bacterium]|nr:hypothetical protein [Phycisphaerales bacterium]